MKTTVILFTNIIILFTAALLFTPLESEARSSGMGSIDSSVDTFMGGMGGSGGSGGSISEDDCRFCHEDLDRFSSLQHSNPDKHHLLIGKEIPQSTIAPYQTSGITYECASCHLMDQTDVMNFQVSIERDCLQCHPVETVSGNPGTENVHHSLGYRCNYCHSSMMR